MLETHPLAWLRRHAPPAIVLIAPEGTRRSIAFKQSVRTLGWPEPLHVSWLDVLNAQVDLSTLITGQSIVRVESSGECMATERALLRAGLHTNAQTLSTITIEQDFAQDHLFPSCEAINDCQLERGELPPSAQWYRGLAYMMQQLKTQLAASHSHHCTIDPTDVLHFFDKRLTHQHWHAQGLPVAPALMARFAIQSCTQAGSNSSPFDCLLSAMQQQGLGRVFIKLAHGSSGSGAIALEHIEQHGYSKIRAYTTLRQQNQRWFNSRKLQRSFDLATIRQWVNQLCSTHPVHIEKWLPKSSFQGQVFDVRVVVCDQQAQHVLMRCSHSPITNLHLGNQRGNIAAFAQAQPDLYRSLLALSQRAMQGYPRSLYAGIDLLCTGQRWMLLEANAFGDYHPSVTNATGLDTYSTQLFALRQRQLSDQPSDQASGLTSC